ncbi:MAG TPA: hypothetical protein VMZ53_15220 [Kofleriaceae bacterium]|nr:hypothetical protein [Kofleriaceae bacterium]
MRFVILVVGIVLGIAGTVAYGMFAATDPVPVARPVPTHAPMTVTLDESFLTALMQRSLSGSGSNAVPGVDVEKTRVRAELRGDQIIVHASVEVLGAPTEGTVAMRPVLRDGRIVLDVVETNLGSIALPAMDQLLDKQINDRIHSLLDGMPVTITALGIDPVLRSLVLSCQVDLERLEREGIPAAAAPAPAAAAPQAAR